MTAVAARLRIVARTGALVLPASDCLMIVTIDGPAGAGKSTVSRKLAARLGFRFLDTGAMYRAVAWAALRRKLDWNRPQELVSLVKGLRIELPGTNVLVDGRDVTHEIRTPEVTALIHYAADNPGVRTRLVELQRQAAAGGHVVSEGRDQGTVVFPNAGCKIFLTASPEERARRRQEDLRQRGREVDFEEILSDQQIRDQRDATRPVGPLKQAADAVLVLTDGLTLEQVVDRLEDLVRTRM